jgi:enoyl-CoA hydratase/carnithine racemase
MADEGVALRTVRHGDGGHLAELVLDRPEALNALSTAFARQLAAASAAVAAEPSIRAVVISSSQLRAFCVGADLKERNAFTDDDLRSQRLVLRAAFGAVLALPVPAIAAVEGFALGGGYEIALSCDLIVAGEGATIGLPEVSVGLVPGGGGTQLLLRRAGWSCAADLIFTGRRVDAAEALRLGAVDRMVPAGTARHAALELAAAVAANSPVGVRHAKRALRLGQSVDLAAGLEVEDAAWRAAAFSPDRVEGIRAFAEKRRPQWPG